jgi:hypothetical protein
MVDWWWVTGFWSYPYWRLSSGAGTPIPLMIYLFFNMENSNAGLRLPSGVNLIVMACYGQILALVDQIPISVGQIQVLRTGSVRREAMGARSSRKLCPRSLWHRSWAESMVGIGLTIPKCSKFSLVNTIYIYLSRWNMITWQIAWQKYSKVLRQTMINKQHIGVPKFERQAFGVANLGWPCWAP